jgi:hypothetical protein
MSKRLWFLVISLPLSFVHPLRPFPPLLSQHFGRSKSTGVADAWKSLCPLVAIAEDNARTHLPSEQPHRAIPHLVGLSIASGNICNIVVDHSRAALAGNQTPEP